MTPAAILACGVVLLAIAGIVLVLFKSGDPARLEPGQITKPRTRRDELLGARRKIRGQIEILTNPMRGRDYTPYSQAALKELQDCLRRIEDELGGARTGPLLGRGGIRQEEKD